MVYERSDTSIVRRAVLPVAALGCSAVLFYLGVGLAITPVAVLAWCAPLPVLLLAPRTSIRVVLGVAFLAFLLGSTNSWGFYLHSGDVPLPIGMLISVSLSLMFVLAVWLFVRLLRRGRVVLAAVAPAAAWTAVAYLIQQSNPMGLMGTFANSQGDASVPLQIASVTGAWGVEFLVLFVPASVAAVCAPGVTTAARWRTGVIGAVVVVTAFGYGAVRLAGDEDLGPTQRVALIAHNHAGWGVDVGTPAGRELVSSYAAAIDELPDGVRTVVLPEGAFSADEDSLPGLVHPISQAARALGADVVAGLTKHEDGRKLALALTIPADGGEPEPYLKHHDMVSPPGTDHMLREIDGIRTGVEICGDVNFADPSRAYSRAGAQLMAVPASDEVANGWMHSRVGVLRGVEYGYAMAWAGRQGVLMIADGFGRVVADAHTGGSAPFTTVVAEVATGPGETPYAELGDWFAWLCVLLALAGFVVSRSPGTLGRR